MNNNSTIIWAVIIVIIVLGLGWWYVSMHNANATPAGGTNTGPSTSLPVQGSVGGSASGSVQNY